MLLEDLIKKQLHNIRFSKVKHDIYGYCVVCDKKSHFYFIDNWDIPNKAKTFGLYSCVKCEGTFTDETIVKSNFGVYRK